MSVWVILLFGFVVFFGEAAGHCLDEMSQSPCESVGSDMILQTAESVGPGRPTCCDSRGLYDAVIGFLPDQVSNLLGPVRHALEKQKLHARPQLRQISHHAWGNNAADLFIASMESQSSLGMVVNIGLAWCYHTWYTWYLCYWEVTYQDLP